MTPSVEELAIVADELPVAIWLGRVPSGEVVYTNRAFREVLGIEPPPGAARGEFVEPYGVHLPDGRPYPEELMPFERAIAARATVVLDDLVIHRRDGRRVNLRVFAKPLFAADGTITHILEAFTDITREVEAERARLDGERQLARAQRLESIGQLVMGIAHDFNNLLTVTTLTTSRLLAMCPDAELQAALRDIDTVTASAVDLVKKLQSVVRRPSPQLASIELAPIVRELGELALRTFERRVALVVDGEGGTWVRGDRVQLEQALMNLLFNARDAIAGAGTISIAVRVRALAAHEIETCPPGDYVVVSISDDGCGIDPEIREHVFEPYFTTKTRGAVKGTGLGLATVHGIVRTHGGYIEARPAQPRGTTMVIAIPHHPPAVIAPGSASGVDAPPRGAGQLVLVVDDEPLVRTATIQTLVAFGYRVVGACDGTDALAVFDRHADELAAVILDLVMPGMTAVDVCRALVARRAALPILVITGSALRDDIEAMLAAGARTWLAKPFEVGTLAEVVYQLVAPAPAQTPRNDGDK